MDQLEAYIKGEPLNDAMADLMRGEEPASERAPEQRAKPGEPRELNDDEREHLRRLQLEPGWAILLRMLDWQLQRAEAEMKRCCMDNPLAKRDQIAEGWAYIAIMRKDRIALETSVDAEVQILEANQQREEDAR